MVITQRQKLSYNWTIALIEKVISSIVIFFFLMFSCSICGMHRQATTHCELWTVVTQTTTHPCRVLCNFNIDFFLQDPKVWISITWICHPYPSWPCNKIFLMTDIFPLNISCWRFQDDLLFMQTLPETAQHLKASSVSDKWLIQQLTSSVSIAHTNRPSILILGVSDKSCDVHAIIHQLIA